MSPLLKRVVYPALSRAGYLRRRAANGQLCIITYHGVRPAGYVTSDVALDGNLVSAETLRTQLRFLKSRYHVISPESLLQWLSGETPLPARSILVTCDDGLQNVLTDMTPILLEEGIRVLFFVTAAAACETRSVLWYEELFLLLLRAPAGKFEISCGGGTLRCELGTTEQRRATWWDCVKQLSRFDAASRRSFLDRLQSEFGLVSWRCFHENGSASCRRFGLLTRGELQSLAAVGMTIGAHTLTHPVLSQTPPELARSEISESRIRLQAALGKEVWALAYPFGDPASAGRREWQMAEQAGFRCAFMNVGGGIGSALPRFALPRVHVTAEMDMAEFEAHVSGFYSALRVRFSGNVR